MRRKNDGVQRIPGMVYLFVIILFACLALSPHVFGASSPLEMFPEPDGALAYRIIPIPAGIQIERDVMVILPDGIKLACNVYRPNKPGKFPVILSMTPYGKDQTPPTFKPDGSPLPNSYDPYLLRVYAHGADLGHMKISMLAPWEGPDPAFWVPHDYVVIIVDKRGSFKSEGKAPNNFQQGDDIFHMIEWAARQEWSNGNVGMIGVSALCINQYYAASHQPSSPHLKAIIPWEGSPDAYRDSAFWGGIPETNFTKRDLKEEMKKMPADQAEKVWAAAIDTVRNQNMMQGVPKFELITIPALICASWSDKGLHTRGTFEAYRRIPSKDKWLYTHGGKKWERFYSEDGFAYQKKFFDYYLKGVENGWKNAPRVRLEVRETRDDYTVRFENEFPLARTEYQTLYLDAQNNSLNSTQPTNEGKVVYNSVSLSKEKPPLASPLTKTPS